MDDSFTSLISEKFPRLAELLGRRGIQSRDEEFQRPGLVPLWQVERDLELLTRHLRWSQIESAYRALLQNPGQFIAAMYEIRVAAMLAPFVDKLELEPKIGEGSCDLRCEVGGRAVFVEVTTREDKFPPDECYETTDPLVYGRVAVEASFDPTTARGDPLVRGIPASQELRERIVEEISQLPSGELTVLVVGAPGGRSLDMESALWGDEIIRGHEFDPGRTGPGWWQERVPNGLFRISDDMGGTSGLSALVWMKLVPHFHNIRVHSRLFKNPLAIHPLPPETEELFLKAFDRRAILLQELERIKKTLLEQYEPERLIVFGSLADDSPDTVHEWSDIDLAVVKSTPLGFMERIREIVSLLQPRVGLNVLVYTPEEFERAEQQGHFFVRDEILQNGRVLFP